MRRAIDYGSAVSECFGCGPANPGGLGLSFLETESGVESAYTVPAYLQGAPGVVHGGILATLLDEVMCMAVYAKLGFMAVTGELTVRYLRPVPTDLPLVISGRITVRTGRSAFIEGAIRSAASHEDLTRARGRFFPQEMK